MKKLLDLSKLLLGWPFSLLALFFIFQLINSRAQPLVSYVQNINYLLLGGGGFFFFCFFFLRSFLWQQILKEKNHILPLHDASYLWAQSELKRFIPGNIWSFLSKSLLFSQKGIDKSTLWSSMLIEIEFFLIGCIIVFLLSLPFLFADILSLFPHKELLKNVLFIVTGITTICFIFQTKLNVFKPFKKFLPSFSPFVTFKLLCISVFSLFCYGIGTYLATTSLVYLNPLFFLSFVGFFVLSLLIGYLSFITPMGLGVREGIVIKGLQYFMDVGIASVAAVLSRIVLIISELLFLLCAALWHKTKINLSEHMHIIALLVGFTLYIAYFSSVSFLRYENFYAGRFDLGNMDQVVWNTTQGNIFEFTNPNGTTPISRLGFHADFILVLLSPLYVIWSDARVLLLVQTIVLALGCMFVYLLAKKVLNNKDISLVLAFAYLLTPSIQYVNLFDFHAVSFASTFLLGAFYFMYKKWYAAFFFMITLAVLTKEQIWIIAVFFGIYIFFVQKKRVLGISIATISLLCFYYIFEHAIPNARGAAHFATSFYADFGDSPLEILKNIFLNPSQTVSSLLVYSKFHYLYQLLISVGFLSLLSPFILLFTAPDLGINLLSNNPQFHQIYYQYTAAITPFIYISAILGIQNIVKKFPNISPRFIVIYILFWSLYTAYWHGPLPGAKNPSLDMITKQKSHRYEIAQYLNTIPQEKKVAAANNLGAHLSQRRYLFTVPLGLNEADIIIFNLDDPYSQPPPKAQKEMINNLQNNKKYKLVFEKGSVYAFEKNTTQLLQ